MLIVMTEGILEGSLGGIIGTGKGRCIGLMLIIARIIMVAFAFIFGFKKSIRGMERGTDGLVNNQK